MTHETRHETRLETSHEATDETKQHAQLNLIYRRYTSSYAPTANHCMLRSLYASDAAAGRPGRIRAFT